MKDVIMEMQDLRHLVWTKTRKSSGTAGSFLKSYDDTGEKKRYYKLSDYDPAHGIVGHECVNEIITQRLLTILSIPHLTYRLLHADVLVEGKEYVTYLCESDDFKSDNESKVALEDYFAMERRENESPFDFCLRMGWEEEIYAMLVIDFLILNRDRHGANTEVLLDRKKQTIRQAPLFDHGLSFVCRCQRAEELETFDVMSDLKVQAFVGSRSTFENIRLVPKSFLKGLPSITDRDLDKVFAGLEGILEAAWFDKIREMISRRWSYIDSLRNS